jgi:hypothetical protein
MCSINPKRKQSFALEFYTAHEMSDARWQELVLERILELEQAFNATGEIRVHINETERPVSEESLRRGEEANNRRLREILGDHNLDDDKKYEPEASILYAEEREEKL